MPIIRVDDESTGEQPVKVRRYENVKRKCLEKDKDYYRNLARMGGKVSKGGFTNNSSKAREAVNKRWEKYRAKQLQAEQK